MHFMSLCCLGFPRGVHNATNHQLCEVEYVRIIEKKIESLFRGTEFSCSSDYRLNIGEIQGNKMDVVVACLKRKLRDGRIGFVS